MPSSTSVAEVRSSHSRITISIYSMYSHIAGVAENIKAGIEGARGKADILQYHSQLRRFIFGIPTHFGSMHTQLKAFWDSTGQPWANWKYAGKYAGLFVSTPGLGGGQKVTAMGTMSTLAYHGMIYVPFGYSRAFDQLSKLEEPHGNSPWGAGTFASADGSRQPSALEMEIAGQIVL